MPIDGCFIHYLVEELNSETNGFKINKIYQPSLYELILQLRGKNKDQLIVSKQLYINCSLDKPRLYLSDEKFINPEVPLNFCMLLRKYLDRGIINYIKQIENDRIVEISITSANELGDDQTFLLIFELMGRNSNLILTNKDYIIVDALRKLTPSESNSRIIIPKAKYVFPLQPTFLNPFEVTNCSDDEYHLLQGCSKLLISELRNLKISDINNYLTNQIFPIIFFDNQKNDIYFKKLSCFSNTKTSTFPSFSKLLEFQNQQNNDHLLNKNYQIDDLTKRLKKLIQSKRIKLANLEEDLENAYKNQKYNHLGMLLQSSLYLVKQGDDFIEINDFTNNYEPITIELNPLLTPSENLKLLFSKGKKANNAISKVNEQIDITKNELEYLELICDQLSFASFSDFEEIRQELLDNNYIKSKKNIRKIKKHKLNLTRLNLENSYLLIGKNNLQNEHLIHKIAKGNDLWFHVKDAPGAHVVLVVPNGSDQYQATEQEIRLASEIAAFFSKMQNSSSVPVDYTKIRYLKKIPGKQGYNVTYTNNKTIYIDPKIDTIKKFKLI